MVKGYIILVIAILIEVMVSTSLRFAKDSNYLFAVSMTASLICFSLFAIVYKYIPVGIGYTIGEVAGTVIICLIGYFVFLEVLTTLQLIGVIIGMISLIMINWEVK